MSDEVESKPSVIAYFACERAVFVLQRTRAVIVKSDRRGKFSCAKIGSTIKSDEELLFRLIRSCIFDKEPFAVVILRSNIAVFAISIGIFVVCANLIAKAFCDKACRVAERTADRITVCISDCNFISVCRAVGNRHLNGCVAYALFAIDIFAEALSVYAKAAKFACVESHSSEVVDNVVCHRRRERVCAVRCVRILSKAKFWRLNVNADIVVEYVKEQFDKRCQSVVVNRNREQASCADFGLEVVDAVIRLGLSVESDDVARTYFYDMHSVNIVGKIIFARNVGYVFCVRNGAL